jgi:hypothetical protein
VVFGFVIMVSLGLDVVFGSVIMVSLGLDVVFGSVIGAHGRGPATSREGECESREKQNQGSCLPESHLPSPDN